MKNNYVIFLFLFVILIIVVAIIYSTHRGGGYGLNFAADRETPQLSDSFHWITGIPPGAPLEVASSSTTDSQPFHLIMDENNPGPYSIPQPEYINNDYKLDRETYVVKLKDIDNEIANIQKKMTEHESQLNTMRNIRKNIVKEINEIDYKTNTLFV